MEDEQALCCFIKKLSPVQRRMFLYPKQRNSAYLMYFDIASTGFRPVLLLPLMRELQNLSHVLSWPSDHETCWALRHVTWVGSGQAYVVSCEQTYCN